MAAKTGMKEIGIFNFSNMTISGVLLQVHFWKIENVDLQRISRRKK